MVLNIINSASILFILALGLFIIYGLMGVVNLAHGEFIMLGAFVAVVIGNLGWSPWLAFLFAPIILGVFSVVVERFLIRHLYGKIMESILATWGLAILIRQLVEWFFGKGYQPVSSPINSTISILGTPYPMYRFIIIIIAVLLVVALIFIERKTNLGTTVRAVIENASLASSLGININKVYRSTFVVGGAVAGFAGALIAPLVTVYPNMGLGYVINAFLAVLVGGVGSIGLAGSASLLGGIESSISFLFDPIFGSISVVVVALIVMRLKQKAY